MSGYKWLDKWTMLTKEDLVYTVLYITSENIEDGILKITGVAGFFTKQYNVYLYT